MKIKFTQRVVFRDMLGVALKVYEVGDEIEYFTKTDTYFVTSMGGVYFDEAEEV